MPVSFWVCLIGLFACGHLFYAYFTYSQYAEWTSRRGSEPDWMTAICLVLSCFFLWPVMRPVLWALFAVRERKEL